MQQAALHFWTRGVFAPGESVAIYATRISQWAWWTIRVERLTVQGP
jgi:hypothetical protein